MGKSNLQKKILDEAPKFKGIPYSVGILRLKIMQQLKSRRSLKFPVDENLAEITKKYYSQDPMLKYHFGDNYDVSIEIELSAPKPKNTSIEEMYYIIIRRK